MTKCVGLCIRGPLHGQNVALEHPIMVVHEMPPIEAIPTEEPDYNTPVFHKRHEYRWDDEYKYWVYQEPSTPKPKKARERWFFVIDMPLNADGEGPASIENGEVRKMTWEVWDQVCDTHGSFDCLPDAIDKMNELNEERERNG